MCKIKHKKKKIMPWVLLVESLLILCCLLSFFRERRQLEIPAAGTLSRAAGGQEELTVGEGLSLKKGTYRVQLFYETDTDKDSLCMVEDESVSFRGLRSNGEYLYRSKKQTDYEMWLTEDTESLKLLVNYGGNSSLVITGGRFLETYASDRIRLFWVVCGSLLLDVLLFWYRRGSSIEKKQTIFGLTVIGLMSCLPLLTDYLPGANNLYYQLLRIDGIKEGILAGQFPVRVSQNLLEGYGYADSVFASNIVLYPAALLRLVGFDLMFSYKLGTAVLNLFTCIVSYLCFGRLLGSQKSGLLCSMLYTLSAYRLYLVYMMASLEEAFAIAFLPILFYGAYRLVTEEDGQEGRRTWLILAAGISGVIQSNFAIWGIAALTLLAAVILLWKKIFRRKKLAVLLKGMGAALLVNLWYLIPMADYLKSNLFQFQMMTGAGFQKTGVYPAHLLTTFFRRGSSADFQSNGMMASNPLGLGMALVAGGACFLLILWMKEEHRLPAAMVKSGKLLTVLSILSVLPAMLFFPWDFVQKLSPVAAMLVNNLRSASYFLIPAVLFLTVLAGIVGNYVICAGRSLYRHGYFAGMILLVMAGSIFLMDDMMYTTAPVRVYQEEALAGVHMAGGYYLPAGTDVSMLSGGELQAEADVTVAAWSREQEMIEVTCSSQSEQEKMLRLPVLYYESYRALDVDTGEALPILAGENNQAGVLIPGGYTGTFQVSLQIPARWRIAEVVSVMALAGCIYFGRRRSKVYDK